MKSNSYINNRSIKSIISYHFTLLMLRLPEDEMLARAVELLDKLKPKILEILEQ